MGMRLCLPLALFVVSQLIPAARGQDRSDYVSDASYTIGTYQSENIDHSPGAMAEAANKLLGLLDDKQRDKIQHDLDSPERREWTNLPARPDAGGLTLGEMDQKQVAAACELMARVFSPQGYAKMRDIMLADDQLLNQGRPRPGFGTETFAIVIFGTPSESDPWAFQLDGHHIGVNVSITGDELTLSPSFIGTQPEQFELAGKQIRPLAAEIDLAYKLAGDLSQEQLRTALIDTRRGQLVAGPGRDGQIPEAKGLSCAELDDDQKEILINLISQWINVMPERHATERMKQLADEIDEMHFAWYGPTEPRSDVSYRIQGPTPIIEFACQDLGGNPLNHLHTMYRDPTNEYGQQIGN